MPEHNFTDQSDRDFLKCLKKLLSEPPGHGRVDINFDDGHSFSISTGLDDRMRKVLVLEYKFDEDAPETLNGKSLIKVNDGKYYVYF